MPKPFLTAAAFLLCIGLCAAPARAELQLQPAMTATCRPAAAVSYRIEKWKPVCPHGDCFAWRLTCSDGASVTMRSTIHPGTTTLEARFHVWAPWSYALYLLPLAVLAGLAVVGSGGTPAVAVLNSIFLAYFFAAAVALDTSITGNPWSRWVLLRDLLLNGYGYLGAVAAFVLVNLAAAWRGIEFLFFPFRADPLAAGMYIVEGGSARDAAQRLMPSIYELVDPAEATVYYRQQTAHLNAQREKFEAQRALAETYLRLHRTLNAIGERSEGE